MEHVVRLGTRDYHDNICQRLSELGQAGELSMHIQDLQLGKRWLIECRLNIPERMENQELITKLYAYYLANAVADTIIAQFEQKYMQRIWRNKVKESKTKGSKIKWPQINDQEALNKALAKLAEGMTQKRYQNNRKTRLVALILASLNEEKIFDIEGFLQFRAREYLEELDQAVSLALDDYLIEREYVEFIQLLKRYVDTQISQIDTLHIGFNSLGKFSLYNEEGKEITQQILEEASVKEDTGDLLLEDLLISSLIQVAPRQIVLHICCDNDQNTLQTIRSVFAERVSYCTGCKLCSKL